MSDKGVIYLMSTAVKGLVKIGKSQVKNFEGRMTHLENNGYSNTVGLRRVVAVEVEDYNEKEMMIHRLFEKSRVGKSELFAVDIDLVKQLLLSLEGELIYPKAADKEELFEKASSAPSNAVEQEHPRGKEKEHSGLLAHKLRNMKPGVLANVFVELTEYGESLNAEVIDLKVVRAFRHQKKPFASIYPLLKDERIILMLKLDPATYVDRADNLRDLTDMGHWGAGNLEMRIDPTDEEQITLAKRYISGAYAEVSG